MKTQCEEAINTFLVSTHRSHWLEIGPMLVYVRKGTHLISAGLVKTFDVANISVNEEERGKGWFTALLDVLEARWNGHHVIYVEQILEPRLYSFLENRGYISVNEMSMYKDCSK